MWWQRRKSICGVGGLPAVEDIYKKIKSNRPSRHLSRPPQLAEVSLTSRAVINICDSLRSRGETVGGSAIPTLTSRKDGDKDDGSYDGDAPSEPHTAETLGRILVTSTRRPYPS